MRFIAPRTGAPERTLAEEQEEYLPVTIADYVTEQEGHQIALLRLQFTALEREKVAAGEDLFISLMTFGGAMQPIQAQVGMEGTESRDTNWKVGG